MTFLCKLASTVNLDATYSNGPNFRSPGFQATLTMNATGVLTVDGDTVVLGMIVLIKDQVDLTQNGIYGCSTEGDVGVAAVLMRIGSFSDPGLINNFGQITIETGFTNQLTTWIVTSNVIEVGVSLIEIVQLLTQHGTTTVDTVGTITTGTWNAGSLTTNSFINIPFTTDINTGVIRKGNNPWIHGFNGNLFIGDDAGNFSGSDTDENIIIGFNAGQSLDTANQNIGIGLNVLQSLESGIYNIAIGAQGMVTLGNLANGSYNLAINGGSGYTGSESSNICINNIGVGSESNKMRLGTYGTGSFQQDLCYMDPTLIVNNGIIQKVTPVTGSSYNILVTDYFLACNRVGTIALALPASPFTGRVYIIKDTGANAAAHNITITPAAGTIDGMANRVISVNYGVVILIYGGTEWNIVSTYG